MSTHHASSLTLVSHIDYFSIAFRCCQAVHSLTDVSCTSGMSFGGASFLPLLSGNALDSYPEDRNTQTGFVGSDPNSSQNLQYHQQQRLQQLVQHAQQLLQHQQQEQFPAAKRHQHQQAGHGAPSQHKRKGRNEEASSSVIFALVRPGLHI